MSTVSQIYTVEYYSTSMQMRCAHFEALFCAYSILKNASPGFYFCATIIAIALEKFGLSVNLESLGFAE